MINWKKTFKYSLSILLLLLVILLYIGVEHVLPYSGIKPFRRNTNTLPTELGMDFDRLRYLTKDSISIEGFLIKAEKPIGTLICLHGISSAKERYLHFAKKLHSIGYNVALIDLRAHGKSGGEYCTFGYKEKYDIQQLIDSIEAKQPNLPLGLMGRSLGGAIALQTLELDKRLDFGVIECTFTTFEKVAYEYSDDFTGFKSAFLTKRITKKSAQIAGFEIDKVKPVESCKHIEVPMFVAHGTADEKIPFEMGKENFDALASKDKIFVPVPDAQHSNIQAAGGEAYWEKMKTFLLQQGKKEVHLP